MADGKVVIVARTILDRIAVCIGEKNVQIYRQYRITPHAKWQTDCDAGLSVLNRQVPELIRALMRAVPHAPPQMKSNAGERT